jgi:ketosteroid isomerase-like protein
MSQQNVEIVRSMFAAYRAGEIEAVIDAADADIELRPGLVGGLEGTVYRGGEGFRAFLEDIDAAWEEFRIETEEFRDLGETVLVLGHQRARSRDGMNLEASAGWVCGMRRGKIARFQSFPSSAEALEAVGLRE